VEKEKQQNSLTCQCRNNEMAATQFTSILNVHVCCIIEEHMKLQNMKKWLGSTEDKNSTMQPSVSHNEMDVNRVTGEISNKIRRLSRHFQL
jgi:hypothetical protein